MASANYVTTGRSAFHRRIQAMTDGVDKGFKAIDHDFDRLTKLLDNRLHEIADMVRKKPADGSLIVLILNVRINVIVNTEGWQWISIDANAPIGDAVKVMAQHAKKSLLVTDAQQNYVGLFTRGHAFAVAMEQKRGAKVRDYMVPRAAFIGLPADATVGQALEMFATSKVGRLILQDGVGNPAGLLTMAELLRWIAQQLNRGQSLSAQTT